MARPVKNNADYFSHDTDMRNDPKVRALRRKFGIEGYAIYSMMLEVLADRDYFIIEWNNLNIELLAGDFGIEPERLTEIINYCTSVLGLFQLEEGQLSCETLKRRLSVLLNKRAVQKERFLSQKLENTGVSAAETTQSKVKESKVKESKEKKSKEKKSVCVCEPSAQALGHPPTHEKKSALTRGRTRPCDNEREHTHTYTHTHTPEFLQLSEFVEKHAPRVAQMREPFTDEQAKWLFRDFLIPRNDKGRFIKTVLTQMHNSADLLQKNISAYITFLKFAKSSK